MYNMNGAAVNAPVWLLKGNLMRSSTKLIIQCFRLIMPLCQSIEQMTQPQSLESHLPEHESQRFGKKFASFKPANRTYRIIINPRTTQRM